jgi:arabinofuranan 3-O-arabinosyltransferase
MLAYAAGVVLVAVSGYTGTGTRQVDFLAFWSAAKLALAGNPLAAFDQDALRAAQALPADAEPGDLHWLYPPGFLLLLTPLALLPFWAAWLLFNLLSLSAFLGANWRFARAVPMGRNLLVGAPIVIMTVTLGQVDLLWSGVAVFMFRAVSRDQQGLAGFCLAALSLKPQLGILLPCALVAGRRFEVILWGCIWALLFHGLPTLIVGFDYWQVFFDRMHAIAASLETGLTPHYLMASPYAVFRFLGAHHGLALSGQAIVTLSLAIGTAMLWMQRRHRADLLVGALLVAIPVATPYAFYYSLVLVVPASVFLVRGGYGSTVQQRVLLGLALIGPAVLWISTPLAPLLAPITLALAADAMIFAWKADAIDTSTLPDGR